MKGKQAGGKGETTTYRTKDFHIPVWVRMCSFSVLKRVNIFSHSPHLYGLSSLCTGMWTLRSVDRAKRLPHSLHSNGFSPETKKQKKAFYKNTNNMWYELSYTEPRQFFFISKSCQQPSKQFDHTRMHNGMTLECDRWYELLATEFASERLHSCMSSHVRL